MQVYKRINEANEDGVQGASKELLGQELVAPIAGQIWIPLIIMCGPGSRRMSIEPKTNQQKEGSDTDVAHKSRQCLL